MNILLFGKNGQVGWALQRALGPLGTLTALSTDSTDYCGDFTNPEGIVSTLRRIKPDVIVIAAAYTAVDKAQVEPELAALINSRTIEVIAKEAQRSDAWLIHFSTDYVFSGSGDRAWCEEDRPAPLNVYGKTKLAGEQAIRHHCEKHLIFRTSWVYGLRGNNFPKTMLRLAATRDQLSVINDQFGAPTGADLLADCTAHALLKALVKPELAGLYHLSATGCTTWYDYASLIFDHASRCGIDLALTTLQPVSTQHYPTPARRPLNSRLDTRRFQQTFALQLPAWHEGVIRMLDELTAIRRCAETIDRQAKGVGSHDPA